MEVEGARIAAVTVFTRRQQLDSRSTHKCESCTEDELRETIVASIFWYSRMAVKSETKPVVIAMYRSKPKVPSMTDAPVEM